MSKPRWIFPAGPLFSIGIIAGLGFGIQGAFGLWTSWTNDGKPRRYNVDTWDRKMMERDSRLTGNVNVQKADVLAPAEFQANSALEIESPVYNGELLKVFEWFKGSSRT